MTNATAESSRCVDGWRRRRRLFSMCYSYKTPTEPIAIGLSSFLCLHEGMGWDWLVIVLVGRGAFSRTRRLVFRHFDDRARKARSRHKTKGPVPLASWTKPSGRHSSFISHLFCSLLFQTRLFFPLFTSRFSSRRRLSNRSITYEFRLSSSSQNGRTYQESFTCGTKRGHRLR